MLRRFKEELLSLDAKLQSFSKRIEAQLQQTEARIGFGLETVRIEAGSTKECLEAALLRQGELHHLELGQALASSQEALTRLSSAVVEIAALTSDQNIRTEDLAAQLQAQSIDQATLFAKFEMVSAKLEACSEAVQVHGGAQVQFEQEIIGRFRRVAWLVGVGIAASLGLIAWAAFRLKAF